MSAPELGLIAITLAWFAALGACFGSLLNVFVYRLPRSLSMVHPPSSCPQCRRFIAWYDNIPILGWLVLRGRCRWCRTAISARYPLIEAAVALQWVTLFFNWLALEHVQRRLDWTDAMRVFWEFQSPRSMHQVLGKAFLLYWVTGTILFVRDGQPSCRRWTRLGFTTALVWGMVGFCLPARPYDLPGLEWNWQTVVAGGFSAFVVIAVIRSFAQTAATGQHNFLPEQEILLLTGIVIGPVPVLILSCAHLLAGLLELAKRRTQFSVTSIVLFSGAVLYLTAILLPWGGLRLPVEARIPTIVTLGLIALVLMFGSKRIRAPRTPEVSRDP